MKPFWILVSVTFTNPDWMKAWTNAPRLENIIIFHNEWSILDIISTKLLEALLNTVAIWKMIELNFLSHLKKVFCHMLSQYNTLFNRYRTVCCLGTMRIFALEFSSKNEELSRKRHGAKCPRRDTQSCGQLFF